VNLYFKVHQDKTYVFPNYWTSNVSCQIIMLHHSISFKIQPTNSIIKSTTRYQPTRPSPIAQTTTSYIWLNKKI